jgi:hypothetical protein
MNLIIFIIEFDNLPDYEEMKSIQQIVLHLEL